MKGNVEQIIRELKSKDVLLPQVLEALHHKAALVRVNAVEALGRLAREDETNVPKLLEAIRDPRNAFQLLGTISIAHVGVAMLARVNSPQANSELAELLRKWPEPDRSDLVWYLRSEGIQV